MNKVLKRIFRDKFSGLFEYRKNKKIELPPVDSDLKQSILKGKGQGYFQVAIYNDDTTPMEFVVELLEFYLGYSIKEAALKMAQIHNTGCSGVYTSNEKLANIACKLIQDACVVKGHQLKCCVQSI